MHSIGRCTATLLVLGAAVPSVAGCASDRPLRATMTLAPGQTVEGRFEATEGADGLVQLYASEPKRGAPPSAESATWIGDGRILVAFPDSTLPEERPLGYAQRGLEPGRPWRVVLRNPSSEPVTFRWVVAGRAGVTADWGPAGGVAPR